MLFSNVVTTLSNVMLGMLVAGIRNLICYYCLCSDCLTDGVPEQKEKKDMSSVIVQNTAHKAGMFKIAFFSY